jgi:transcriptional regulator with XRE-family HTH domain
MVAFIHKALGISTQDLSKLLDVSPEHMSRMEHGKRDIERRIYALLGSLAIDARDGKSETFIRLQKLALEQPCPPTVKVEL